MECLAVRRRPTVGWLHTPGIRAVADAHRALIVEGALFRVAGRRSPDPQAALFERLAERGPDAFAEVDGDFVACYVTRDASFAFKSFTSQYQLYLRARDGLASNRLFLLADDAGPVLDEDYFARHTLIVPGMQFHMRGTPLAGIDRVLPGQLVTLGDAHLARQLVQRDYRYRLDAAQRREDVAPEIVRLLRESVKDRLDAANGADVCIEISGGLDSSFIACLVGEVTTGAKGVMFSQPDIPSHRISEQYAIEVADRYGIDLAIVPPSELPPAPQTEPRYGDEPSDFFWFGELFSEAVARIASPGSLVFTGFGADQLFLRSPAFLPYLVQHRQWRTFLRSLSPAGRLLSRSPLSLALQSLVSQIPREPYYQLARRFAGRRWNPFDVSDVNVHRMLYSPVGWLARGASQERYEIERLQAEQALVGDGIVCDDWGYFAAPRAVTFPHFAHRGLVDASPFCDLRLIDYLYDQVSALLVHDFDGRYKELMREAQKGIVPESLRARKNDMFVFNSFQTAYVGRARDFFVSLLDGAPDGWLDRTAALRALDELEFGLMTSSTRSLVAAFGYLSWRQAFVRQLDDHRRSGLHARWQAMPG